MCAVVTIKIYFSGTKVTVPYGAPSYTYYLVSYQEVHSFTSFSIDLPLLALCQYRLCNISDHTISVFGIKACIRRMSHIMFSASCQPLTVPRSFDPSCITTNFGGGCLLKRNSIFGINSFQTIPLSRTKTLENLHYGDQDDVPLSWNHFFTSPIYYTRSQYPNRAGTYNINEIVRDI